MLQNDPFPWFTEPCLRACTVLVTKYGFKDPKVEQIGRERYIRYSKGNHVVSIAYEPGTLPIVELFHPTDDMKNRVIPKLQTPVPEKLARFNATYHKLCRAQKYKEADDLAATCANELQDDMETYLRAQAATLEIEAAYFLRGANH
jgi:hypothetical protein